MFSESIFNSINPQAMRAQENQRKLDDAMTGVSKQTIIGLATMPMNMQTQPGMPMNSPKGWGTVQA